MTNKTRIGKELKVRRGKAEGRGRRWGFSHTLNGITIKKPINSSIVVELKNGKERRVGWASTRGAFIDLVHQYHRNSSIAGGLLLGGVTYDAEKGTINNDRGTVILWIAELKEALQLTPKVSFNINKYVEDYQDDLGEFIVRAINEALK